MNLDSINSNLDAKKFWNIKYGEPDYFSTESDIWDIISVIDDMKSELKSLETEISYRDTENQNHYKLNRTIALHFAIEAGEVYLTKIRDIVESKLQPVEVEKEFADEYGHPYEREFDDIDDPWRENGLFNDDDEDNDGRYK
jgi:hypothetical protein